MISLQHEASTLRDPQRLELTVVPGKSLGTSIWDMINFLREQSRVIPRVDLKYSEESPLSTDSFLTLPANGINMRFDAQSQRLKSVEVYDFSKLRLIYQDNEFCSNKVAPTFLSIYKIFGPTYLGESEKSQEIKNSNYTLNYTLNYPGISFMFPIPADYKYNCSTDLPLELPDKSSPLLSRLRLFCHGSNYREPVIPSLTRNVILDGIGRGNEDNIEIESVVVELKHKAQVNFFSGSNANLISIEIILKVTTSQDLIVDLGRPLRIFYKEEDKMQIHSEYNNNVIENTENGVNDHELSNEEANNSRDEGTGHPIDYFYNYFHLGFDVLFDGMTHRCKKIVLHGNVPGHYDFQTYKRCPYKIILQKKAITTTYNHKVAEIMVTDDDSQQTSQPSQTGNDFIMAETKIERIKQLLGESSGRPLIFNRGAGDQNPFGPTELSGYDGAIFEVKIFIEAF
ncbi:7217_t:CDS:10 [Entrophospora sp. SA101]|nr:12785_t:CDS:10 [Entrophospora sp. SA101]CAJ0862809.1 7217_t:CDS:10 [Entrophospora sp. SA101]